MRGVLSILFVLSSLFGNVAGQTCNVWNMCGAGFLLKAGAAAVNCGGVNPACSDAVCCDATCDNAGWGGCGMGFSNRANQATIVCGSTATSCTTNLCCEVTCDNPGWVGCGVGYVDKAAPAGIVCGATTGHCSTTVCCDANCQSNWGGCNAGFVDKANPAAIVCGGVPANCNTALCCNAMCNNAAFACSAGHTAKINQNAIQCGLTAAACSDAVCCDATCDNSGFSCGTFAGAVAKGGQAAITCGATVATCTEALCCDATCAHPGFACGAGFVDKAGQGSILCGATSGFCTSAACCDATCDNGGWGGCATGYSPKINQAAITCGVNAASCSVAACCDATCDNAGFVCGNGYLNKVNQAAITCGATAGSCTSTLCCDATCGNVAFACGFGFVAKANVATINCGATPALCTDNVCCDATCNNALFACPNGWIIKSQAHLLTCGATAATCTAAVCCDERLCAVDQRVFSNACVACLPGETNVAGDSAAGPDTFCDPIFCGANQNVINHVCTACPAGSTNMASDDASGPDTFCDPTLCLVNERVQSNTCVACLPGSTNTAGDSAQGTDTFCTDTLCGVNERVVNHVCMPCPAGSTNTNNDNAVGGDTFCDITRCIVDYHVVSNVCVACGPGTTNTAGDPATGPNTLCDSVICGINQYVLSNQCQVCPIGSTNVAGDDASGADTFCDPISCSANQRVSNHACAACPAGSTNAAGDPASGPDTLCDPILCQANQMVRSNACTPCNAGSTNTAGDDASGPDTNCDATLCLRNQYVQSNQCLNCPPGTTNNAGDDASQTNTFCDVTFCARDQFVQSNACVPCTNGFRNAAGDDASGGDTTCSRAAGVTVSTTGLSTSEAGMSATFTVVLDSEPFADVIIAVHSSNTGEGVVTPNILTFTNSNWGGLQTVTVTGVQDAFDDGNIQYSVIVERVISSDTDYNGLDPADVQVTNVDDDTIGVSVTPTANIITTEAGGIGTFSVALFTQPTADVTIGISSTDTTEGVVSPSELVFRPGASNVGQGHWGTPQVVTVKGVDDFIKDGDVTYSIVTAPTVSTDPLYNGINPDDIPATNMDDDIAGVRLIPVTSLTTSEDGTQDALINVELLSEPAVSVDVTVLVSDSTEATVAPATFTFLPSNWNVPQTLTATGVDDEIDDGDVSYELTPQTTSTESAYSGVTWSDQKRLLLNLDNDQAGIIADRTQPDMTNNLFVSENGTRTASFTVVLRSQPVNTVVIPVWSMDTTEGSLSVTEVTFDSTNWNVPAVVTVSGVQDNVADGDITFQISMGPSQSQDAKYHDLSIANVAVTCIDDDIPGVEVTPTVAADTSENQAGGVSGSEFTVMLMSEPLYDVTVPLKSGDHTEGVPHVDSLIFTQVNWRQGQTVTILALDDDEDDGDIEYDIITDLTISRDPTYVGIDPPNVRLWNRDDDTAGIIVTPTAGLETTEHGGTAVFTISLTSQPTSLVLIELFSSDTSEGRLDPSSATFGPGDWKAGRNISIIGVQDAVDDGDVTFTIQNSGVNTADPKFKALTVPTISVVNREDDVAGITVATPPDGVVTTESGGTSWVSIVLNTQPVSDVTINLKSSDETEATISPTTVVFTSGTAQMGRGHWGVPVTITVTGIDDQAADGDISYTIQYDNAISMDPKYSGMATADTQAINRDNDNATVFVSQTTGHRVSETGMTSVFWMTLSAQPSSSVLCGIRTNDATEVSISATMVTFTVADWNVPHTVTITGINDAIYDGDISLLVLTDPCTSADNLYNGKDPPDVSVINQDVDSGGAYLLTTLSLPAGQTDPNLCNQAMLDSSALWDIPIGYFTQCKVAPSQPENGVWHDIVTYEIHMGGPRLQACEELRRKAALILADRQRVQIANRLLQDSTATTVDCTKVTCSTYASSLCSSGLLVGDASTKICNNDVCDSLTCCRPSSIQANIYNNNGCDSLAFSIAVTDTSTICQPVTQPGEPEVRYGALYCDAASGLAYARTGFTSVSTCGAAVGGVGSLIGHPDTIVFQCNCARAALQTSNDLGTCSKTVQDDRYYASCGRYQPAAGLSPGSDDDDLPTWALILIIALAVCCCLALLALLLSMMKKKKSPETEEPDNRNNTKHNDLDEGLLYGVEESPYDPKYDNGTYYSGQPQLLTPPRGDRPAVASFNGGPHSSIINPLESRNGGLQPIVY
eukprot:TRINITY_DN19170_c0_g1_i1.p1 TRINITY_DN19170_c0_g1~~TRINITY_DN19170_c0_g1_i1.p1  ORF type:complete len:2162 (+),score=441.36 TRINITY_DN19170_c0_g1_i1:54-6539(+)